MREDHYEALSVHDLVLYRRRRGGFAPLFPKVRERHSPAKVCKLLVDSLESHVEQSLRVYMWSTGRSGEIKVDAEMKDVVELWLT